MIIKRQHFIDIGVCDSGLQDVFRYFTEEGLEYMQAIDVARMLDTQYGSGSLHVDLINKIYYAGTQLPEEWLDEYAIGNEPYVYHSYEEVVTEQKRLTESYVKEHSVGLLQLEVRVGSDMKLEIVPDFAGASESSVYYVFNPLTGEHNLCAGVSAAASALDAYKAQLVLLCNTSLFAIRQRGVTPDGSTSERIITQ